MDEADIICAHNGDAFDIKKINSRLITNGFKPPSPFKTIDTLKAAPGLQVRQQQAGQYRPLSQRGAEDTEHWRGSLARL
jgi:hypothetical protein